ncbi:MAG: hypothetical protein H7X88_07990 [Gloeobacteraceae cyanobacterium ES-bin-316]|nr:hypothetical protein [Ferruginibacter sp.]
MKKIATLLILILAGFSIAKAQTMADFTVGSSKQDKAFVNIALRKQFSDKFRAGIELQTGSVNYRFISSKLINKGISTTLSFPVSLKLYQKEKLRLDFYTRIGVRFQSVSAQNEAKNKLEGNSSTGFNFEPGLVATLLLSDQLNIQSGFTLPNVFEVSPTFLFENNVTNLFLNVNQRISEKSIFLLKLNAGPAAGADGDTQKFIWSAQAGLRFSVGKGSTKNNLVPDPSF